MAALSSVENRIRRCVWLGLTLHRKREVDFPAYHRSLGASSRTYRRDLLTMRRIGFTLVSERNHHGHVRCVGVSL